MKTINSMLFYILISVSMLMILNSNSIKFNIIGLVIMGIELMVLRSYNKEEIFELLGITWLQKKFENNKLIMDITKE